MPDRDFVNHGQGVSKDAASEINARLSKRLAEERVHRGFSKKGLGELADIDRTTVAFIENPEDNPTVLNLLRYAIALEFDVGKVLSEYLEPHLAAKKSKSVKPKKKRK